MSTASRTVQRAAHVRLTDRDRVALAHVAALQAIRVDDLAVLLAALGGSGQLLGARTTRAIVDRWVRLGLAETHRITTGPGIVTATRTGAEWAGLSAAHSGLPSWSLLSHQLTVAALAAAYVAGGSTWTPGSLVSLPDGCGHRPDGLATRGGLTVAMEIERGSKSRTRWAEIIAGELLRHWPQVHYWATAPVAKALNRWMADELDSGERARVTVRTLGWWAR